MQRKLALSLVFSLLLLGSVATSALAKWAWSDPEFDIEGTIVLVDVGYHLPNGTPVEDIKVESPVTLYAPEGVNVVLLNDHGMPTRIVRTSGGVSDGRINISASVVTPAEYNGESYQVRLTMDAGKRHWQTTGQSGSSISVSGWVPDGN